MALESKKRSGMMKVLYIISTLKRTGPVNILHDIIKYLDRTEFEPHILTLRAEPPNSRIREFETLGVPIDSMQENGKILTPSAIKRFQQFVMRVQPDVVHSMGFRPDMLSGFFLKKYDRISSQLNYPFDDYPMTYGKFIGTIMAKLTARALKRMNTSVACSQDVAGKLTRKGVASPVIFNSIDLALFQPPTQAQREEAREKLSIPARAKTVFIFVGVLTDRKQPLIAIEAFKKFSEVVTDSYMIVLGDGDQRVECENAALPFAKQFRFMGNVADTRPYLTAANYYIATSKAEGMPVSVLEALALRLPVVLSDINPHEEILAFNRNAGEMVTTGSVDDTVRGMLKLHSSKPLVAEDAARSIVVEHLNSESMSKQYQEFYKK